MNEPHADPVAEPEAPPTAIDALLRTARPLLDRAAAPPAAGRAGAPAEDGLGRRRTGARPDGIGEQRGFEEHLRAALVEIAVRLDAEQAAREDTDEAVRALERSEHEIRVRVEARMAEAVAEVHDALGGAAGAGRRPREPGPGGRAGADPRRQPRLADGPREASAGGGHPPARRLRLPRLREPLPRPRGDGARAPAPRTRSGSPGWGVVADLGCGRGEFLELLRDAGSRRWAWTRPPRWSALARDKGLDAEHGDMFAFLAARPGLARRHPVLPRRRAPLARRPHAPGPPLRRRRCGPAGC